MTLFTRLRNLLFGKREAVSQVVSQERLPQYDLTNRVSKERELEFLVAVEVARKSGDLERLTEAHVQYITEVYGIEPREEGD
jgi:hypothetical protein